MTEKLFQLLHILSDLSKEQWEEIIHSACLNSNEAISSTTVAINGSSQLPLCLHSPNSPALTSSAVGIFSLAAPSIHNKAILQLQSILYSLRNDGESSHDSRHKQRSMVSALLADLETLCSNCTACPLGKRKLTLFASPKC